VPITALVAGGVLEARVRLSVYVRRLPTRRDQEVVTWNIPLEAARMHARGEGPLPRRVGEAGPVWTPEDLGEIEAPGMDLGRLRRERRKQIPFADQVALAVRSRDPADIYPGREKIVVSEDDASSESAFAAWRRTLPAGQWPLGWRPVLDVR